MIAKLTSKAQYGKQGTLGINLLSGLNGEEIVSYAHSTQDALEWVKAFPLYENASTDEIGNGIVVISSQWQLRAKNAFETACLVDLGLEQAEFERQQIIIQPVNTIYENTGFEGQRQSERRGK